MHTLIVNEPIEIGRGRQLPRGSWLADTVNAGLWLAQNPRRVELHPAPVLREWDKKRKNVLVIRPGGLGDLIMLTPILRALHQLGQRVSVCTVPSNATVLEGLHFVHECIDYPLRTDLLRGYDAVVSLEGTVEDAEHPATEHALECFWRKFPFLCIPDRQPELWLSEFEKAAALLKWPRPKGKHVVGVQLAASSPVRSYPQVHNLLKVLLHMGCGLRLFGEPGRHPVQITAALSDRVQVLPAANPAPNFRQSMALAADCDCLVCPDSSLVHVAGALGIPCVALYGSFPAIVRVKYYPTVLPIEGRGECAGCCHHGRPKMWPQAHCARSQFCHVLDSIHPAAIAAMVKQVLERRAD